MPTKRNYALDDLFSDAQDDAGELDFLFADDLPAPVCKTPASGGPNPENIARQVADQALVLVQESLDPSADLGADDVLFLLDEETFSTPKAVSPETVIELSHEQVIDRLDAEQRQLETELQRSKPAFSAWSQLAGTLIFGVIGLFVRRL